MVNPTSCAAKEIKGTLSSVAGHEVPVSTRFQVSDCSRLDFEPELAMDLSGRRETTDGRHPTLKAVLTQADGGANLKKVRVKLPYALALESTNAQALCEAADGAKLDPTCPRGSIVGRARAETPILDEPLTGPVHFVKNTRRTRTGRVVPTLPRLVIPLRGQGVRLNLSAVSEIEDEHLVTTFDAIPDAAVSRFELQIDGGRNGILAVTGGKGASICKQTNVADMEVDGQNHAQADEGVYLTTPACPLKVLSRSVTRTSVKLRVGGLGKGRLTASGTGVRTTRKAIDKSTVATITAKRRRAGRGPTRVRVTFDPAGPAKPRSTTK